MFRRAYAPLHGAEPSTCSSIYCCIRSTAPHTQAVLQLPIATQERACSLSTGLYLVFATDKSIVKHTSLGVD
jgi:hypothetical protein